MDRRHHPPDATTADTTCGAVEDGTGAAALYSGCGENLDRSIVRQVSVPAGGGTLSFQALWDTEEQWDYGFVQVSTDGGKTWTSLSTEDTTSEHDPGAVGNVVSELPGFTGDSGGGRPRRPTCRRTPAKKILLGFRYITDSGVNEGGFWVRNIDVAGTSVPSDSLAGWKTITQVNPGVGPGLDGAADRHRQVRQASYHNLKIDKSFRGSLSGAKLRGLLGRTRPPWPPWSRWTTRARPSRSTASTRRRSKAPVAMGNRSGR